MTKSELYLGKIFLKNGSFKIISSAFQVHGFPVKKGNLAWKKNSLKFVDFRVCATDVNSDNAKRFHFFFYYDSYVKEKVRKLLLCSSDPICPVRMMYFSIMIILSL